MGGSQHSLKNINKLQMSVSERTPVVFMRPQVCYRDPLPCRKGGSPCLSAVNINGDSGVHKDMHPTCPTNSRSTETLWRTHLGHQGQSSCELWFSGHKDNDGGPERPPTFVEQQGFLTSRLPRPESQGPSKFKVPLHSFQPAHPVVPLRAPRSRLPLLSPGAWASCSQSCSNQTCLSHVQPAGTS